MTQRYFRTGLASGRVFEPVVNAAYTDPTSNAVVIDNFDPLACVDAMREGRMPIELLPTVLHECTHHVTFDSHVGIAIGALCASPASLWTMGIGSNQPLLPHRDVAVMRVHRTLHTPLIEGMAMFAEHDLVTGDSPLVTTMTEHVLPLFSSTNDHLRAARLQPDWVERKRILLSQPVDDQQRYLLGYLAVKALYRRMRAACPPLSDPELFLLTVMRHVFHDPAGAGALLKLPERSDDPAQAFVSVAVDVATIVEHFQDVTERLLTKPAAVGLFHAKAVLQSSGPSPLGDGLDLLAGFRIGLIQVNAVWPRIFKHRSEFRFGVRHVMVDVDDAGTILLDGQPLHGVRAVPNSLRGTVEGTVEAVRLGDRRTTAICVAVYEGLVAVLDCATGEWNPPHLVKQLDQFPSAIALEGAMHEFADKQELVLGNPEIRAMVDDCERQSHETVKLIYPQMILDRRPREERDAMLGYLGTRGVCGAMSEKDQTAVARLSLAAGTGRNIDVLARELSLSADALKHEVRRLNDSTPDLGFPLFEWLDAETLIGNV